MSDWSTLSKKELLELLESYDDEKHIVFKVNLKQGVVGFWDVKKDEINSDIDKLVLMSPALDKWYAEDIQELVEENNELKMKIQKVEEIIDNRLSNDFKPVWNDGKTELFIEEKVGYSRALKQLKKKLIKENIIVEDLE
jgi:hypothetical protein